MLDSIDLKPESVMLGAGPSASDGGQKVIGIH